MACSLRYCFFSINKSFPFRLLYLVLLCFGFNRADAQQIFKGKIYKQKNGKIALNVKLRLTATDDITHTDIKGVFIFYSDQSDSLVVSVIDPRFEPVDFAIYPNEDNFIFVQKREKIIKEPKKKVRPPKTKNTPIVIKINSAEPSPDFIIPNEEEISNPANVSRLLQHKVPGLTVTQAGNNPNEPFQIYNRGISSITQRNAPLIVIDGMPEMSLERLNPEDVASIKIIKSAAEASHFGVMGGGNVIEVKTMQYDSSKPSVRYHASIGGEFRQEGLTVTSAEEFRQLAPNWDDNDDTDWADEVSQIGMSHRHHLSYSIGNSRVGLYASAGYENREGVLRKSGLEKKNARLSLRHSSKNKRTVLTATGSVFNRESQLSQPIAVYDAYFFNPTYDKDVDFTDPNRSYDLTPAQKTELNPNLGHLKDWSGGILLEKYLAKRNKIAFHLSIHNRILHWGEYQTNNFNFFQRYKLNRKHRFANFKATKEIWLGNLNITRFIGLAAHLNKEDNDYFEWWSREKKLLNFENLVNPDETWGDTLEDVDSGVSQKVVSAYAGGTATKDIWTFNFNARFDKTYIQDSVANDLFFGLNISADLTRFLNLDWVNKVNLSVGYGKTGQVGNVQDGLVDHEVGYLLAEEFIRYLSEDEKINIEKKKEIDLQLNLSLFKNKLNAVLNIYDNVIYDQLLDFGFDRKGAVGNNGIELFVNYNPAAKGNFIWQPTLSFSRNKSVVLDLLRDNQPTFLTNIISTNSFLEYIWIENDALAGQFYGFKSEDELQSGRYMPKDLDGDDRISWTADMVTIGNTKPSYSLALTNVLKFRNWDAIVNIRSVVGHDLYNHFRREYEVSKVERIIWGSNYPKLVNILKTKYYNDERTNPNVEILDVFMEKASFIKLDFVSLGYRIKFKKGQLRLYLAGHDLLTITGYTGIDPEPVYQKENVALLGGYEPNNRYYRSRQMVFGAQFSL